MPEIFQWFWDLLRIGGAGGNSWNNPFVPENSGKFMNLSAARIAHNLRRATDLSQSLEITLGWGDPMGITDAHPNFPNCPKGLQERKSCN